MSPGCERCYAERLQATRLAQHRYYRGLAVMGEHGPRFTGESRLIRERLDEPLRAQKPRSIFVCDLGDLFYEGHPFEDIAAVYGVMAIAQRHTFQVLTKRPKRMLEFYRWLTTFEWPSNGQPADANRGPGEVCARAARKHLDQYRPLRPKALPSPMPWPLPNVHVGVSVEDDKRAVERIPILLDVPAALRFLSVEPLLEHVDLERYLYRKHADCAGCRPDGSLCSGHEYGNRVDWVIAGGESGPDARPFHLEWARSLRDQCRAAKVPYFLKQLGAAPRSDDDDDRRHCGDMMLPHPFQMRLQDSHGGDEAEWPEDLRVRQLAGEIH